MIESACRFDGGFVKVLCYTMESSASVCSDLLS